jgi:hypothetical protein
MGASAAHANAAGSRLHRRPDEIRVKESEIIIMT